MIRYLDRLETRLRRWARHRLLDLHARWATWNGVLPTWLHWTALAVFFGSYLLDPGIGQRIRNVLAGLIAMGIAYELGLRRGYRVGRARALDPIRAAERSIRRMTPGPGPEEP